MGAFTGERPGRGPGYDYDDSRHRVAYLAAEPLVAGRDVVDAGSGDGVGAAILATSASSVAGLDYHEPSVLAARATHGSTAVTFEVADLGRPWPVRDADVAVAFQIIEHFDDDHAFVDHALAAVRPGGRVVITTPNRLTTFSDNPYHVREYVADELHTLLAAHADEVDLRGVHGNERVATFDRARRAEVQRWLRLDPWGLRDRLPSRLVEVAFAGLSTVVRRRASAASGMGAAPITVDDFTVRHGDLDTCLDFFAVVTRPG